MSIDLDDPIALMLVAAAALERSGVECAAYGGVALGMYGEPREMITGFNGLNVKRYLDLFVQDDTDVDWMTLEIEFCPCGSDPT